jgi:hypothetical protein
MNDQKFRAEIAALAESHATAMRNIRDRNAAEFRRKSAREGMARVWLAADSIRYAGMPATIVRGYQEARRKREDATR